MLCVHICVITWDFLLKFVLLRKTYRLVHISTRKWDKNCSYTKKLNAFNIIVHRLDM